MANVIITLKIMPESPDVDLDAVQQAAEEKIVASVGDGDRKVEVEPVAFGLKALRLTFVADESEGTTDELEAAIAEIEGVNSVEAVDVRRAIG